jgi:S-DNA-T family DNA segregation ATPase FtsK/SpoIIIE
MAAPRVITVSQLRAACLDPKWRERWLRGENPAGAPPRGRGPFPVQGTLFHQLAEAFTEWLAGDRVAAPLAEADGLRLWKELYDRFAVEHINKLVADGALPSAHHLSRALENLCQRLVALRTAAGGKFKTWRDLFLTQEFELHRIEVETDHGMLLVSGRPDAVRQVFGEGLEVVDYKLSRGASLKEDLIQVAAYAHLLATARPGLRFAGVLEYYEPALHVTPATERDLHDIWNEVIRPALDELTGGTAGGQRNTGIPACTAESIGRHPCLPNAAIPPSANQPGRAVISDDLIMAQKIERTYANFSLKVRVLGHTEGPRLRRYQVEPGEGVKVVSLANRAEDLQVALKLAQPPLIQAAPGCVTIDLPKDKPETVLWADVLRRLPADSPPMSFPVGVSVDGELVTADFSDSNTCHALVAGVAGSGKSEFLKSMAASLLRRNSPERFRLVLVDPKAVTFTALAGCQHLAKPIMTDLGETILFLHQAVDEMEARYRTLAAVGHENIAQRGADSAMPYWLVIFDEFADLILRGKKEKQEFERLVGRLAQKGRAAGMHLVLATQRPDRNVVSGLIKGNLPLKICLRVTNAINSQIVLDTPGAETLLGRGDLLVDRGAGPLRAQSPYVSAEELRKLCL